MNELTTQHEREHGIKDVTARCPKCRSTDIESRDVARRYGGAIGAILGTTSGVASGLAGAEIGFLGGPIGAMLGGVAGVVIEGIFGGAAGCAAGLRLGAAIDRNVLNNQQCRTCGHAFRFNL